MLSARVPTLLAGAAAAALAGATLTAPGADAAAKKGACHVRGATILKKSGHSLLYRIDEDTAGIGYYACSTRYRKELRLVADASQLVDETFERGPVTLGATRVTFVYCSQYDTGYDRYTIIGNLLTGRATQTVKPITDTEKC